MCARSVLCVQDMAGSDLVLAECVRCAPNGSGPETIPCVARTIGSEASGQRFRAEPDPMRIGSGTFTGSLHNINN